MKKVLDKNGRISYLVPAMKTLIYSLLSVPFIFCSFFLAIRTISDYILNRKTKPNQTTRQYD
jgi:hypothetical protein